jgi:phosphoribosylformylglycinamidine cyclo-ligase
MKRNRKKIINLNVNFMTPKKDKKNEESQDMYAQRGVSSSKKDVHKAIEKLGKGLYPKAFCTILPDYLHGRKTHCNISHADGAGTKTSLAYIYWKETGDSSVWKGVVQDSIVMNLDDLACVGAVNVPLLLSASIGRNAFLIPESVLSTIIEGTIEFVEKMKQYGISIVITGGETADVGDLVRTIVIDHTITTSMKRSDVIVNKIQPGDIIVGFASFGQCAYESEYNSGIGSNGLTSLRHDLLGPGYGKKYPESFDPILKKKRLAYCAPYNDTLKWNVQETFPKWNYGGEDGKMNFGKFLLSPTRTYAPVIKKILTKIPHNDIHGIIHCSGGGQTKVMKFVDDNIAVIKNNLFPMPTLFQIIKDRVNKRLEREGKDVNKSMYSTYNMGHRLEMYVPKNTANELISISKDFGIDAQIVGYVKSARTKKLTIKTPLGEFVYE